jgi:hypothetical protein
MDRVTCPYIKRNGSICGGVCTRLTGCARHWKLYEKNMKKNPALFVDFLLMLIRGIAPNIVPDILQSFMH